jgi:hypothetical protein
MSGPGLVLLDVQPQYMYKGRPQDLTNERPLRSDQVDTAERRDIGARRRLSLLLGRLGLCAIEHLQEFGYSIPHPALHVGLMRAMRGSDAT